MSGPGEAAGVAGAPVSRSPHDVQPTRSRDLLLYGTTLGSADLRHVVPLAIGDPLLYVERAGSAHLVASAVELPRLRALDDLEVVSFESLGLAALAEAGSSVSAAREQLAARTCRDLGVTAADVPADFPLGVADRLRSIGIDVVVAGPRIEARRRIKLSHELDGIRRAQAAAEAAMTAVREGIRQSRTVSSESLRERARRAIAGHDVLAEYMIIAHGAQAASVHEPGSGEIAVGSPIVVDFGIRDVASGCWADMTRTFCSGSPPAELARFHETCLAVHEAVTPLVAPGVLGSDLHRRASEIVDANGFPTMLTAPGSDRGFFHGLGHGVGLSIHEAPVLAPGGGPLVPGDVVTIEPGVYRPGFGGARIEDMLLVTDGAAERLTQFSYELG